MVSVYRGAGADYYAPSYVMREGWRVAAVNTSPQKQGRVLIVDDDRLLLGLLCTFLQEAGYTCDSFISGRDVLDAIDAQVKRQGPLGWSPWDVLILDVNLLDIEGFQLLEKIRQREGFRTVPALFISGARLDETDMERGLALGALDYVAKPFRNTILLAKVNNFAELGHFRRLAHWTALALEESETRYRELFEHIADPVLVHDFEGRILDVNEASCTSFGYGRDELVSMRVQDLVLPEYRTVLFDNIPVTPMSEPILIEVEFRSPDRQTIICEVVQRLIVQRDHKVILSVARDITARKRAEEHLRWRNRELSTCYTIARTVGESLDLSHIFTCSLQETLQSLDAEMGALFLLGDDDRPTAVAHQDLSDSFVEAVETGGNESHYVFRKIVSTRQTETMGGSPSLPPAVLRAALEQGIESLLVIPIESRGLTLGLLMIAYRHSRELQDREVEMLNVIGTEIGMAVENGRLYSAVMDSERRYRELFGGIGDPVLLHDIEGCVQAVNQSACSLLGFTEEELLSESLERIGGERYSHKIRALADEVDDRGRLPLFESVLQTRSGREVDVEVHARIVTSGGQISVLSVLRDISERKLEERRALVVGSVRRALGSHRSLRDYLNEALRVLSAFAGCGCVGIRVVDPKGKVPYMARTGFTHAFIESEEGRDLQQSRCVCAQLLRGDFHPNRPGFTNEGSFFCDNLSALIGATDTQVVRAIHELPLQRSGCLQAPFESVALIAIHRGSEVVGLIHVADTRTGRVSRASVGVLEEVGGIIGAAIRQFDLEESLGWETRQTEIGFGLTVEILQGKPLEEAIGHVLEQIAEATGFEILTVERYHPSQDTMEMWVCRCPGLEQDLQDRIVPCEATPSGRVVKTGEIIVDFDAETRLEHIHPALRAMKVQKVMGFPIGHKDQVMGVLSVAGSGSVRTREQIVKFLSAIADQLALAIGWTDAQMELERSRRELHSLSAQLIRAQEAERARIARELHDRLGQILTSISIDIDRHAARTSRRDASFQGFLAKFRTDLNEAHATVRELTASLRPGILDDLGLVAAVESYLEEYEDRTGIACHFDSGVDSLELGQDISVALYRVAQEALTNAARHSGAQRVEVKLSREDQGHLLLRIRDDGCGFDLASLDWQTSFGLLGMRERLQLVGGQMEIVTRPGAGTEIKASVPGMGGKGP